MGQVEEVLVVGVGVHRRHQAPLDAEGIVEDLDHRDEAVGRAGGVGDDGVLGRVEGLIVDADHERCVDVGRGSRDDHSPGPALDVGPGLLAVGEDTGRLDDDVNAEIAPREGLRVALGEHPERLPADADGGVRPGHLGTDPSVGGVVLEESGVDLDGHEVVDPDDLHLGAGLADGTQEVATDAAKSVDSDSYGHR